MGQQAGGPGLCHSSVCSTSSSGGTGASSSSLGDSRKQAAVSLVLQTSWVGWEESAEGRTAAAGGGNSSTWQQQGAVVNADSNHYGMFTQQQQEQQQPEGIQAALCRTPEQLVPA